MMYITVLTILYIDFLRNPNEWHRRYGRRRIVYYSPNLRIVTRRSVPTSIPENNNAMPINASPNNFPSAPEEENAYEVPEPFESESDF